jgi:hypothetical protein
VKVSIVDTDVEPLPLEQIEGVCKEVLQHAISRTAQGKTAMAHLSADLLQLVDLVVEAQVRERL